MPGKAMALRSSSLGGKMKISRAFTAWPTRPCNMPYPLHRAVAWVAVAAATSPVAEADQRPARLSVVTTISPGSPSGSGRARHRSQICTMRSRWIS